MRACVGHIVNGNLDVVAGSISGVRESTVEHRGFFSFFPNTKRTLLGRKIGDLW